MLKRHEDPAAEEWRGDRWEYETVNIGRVIGPGLTAFNQLGDEGWEFVAVAKDYAIFKRPKGR